MSTSRPSSRFQRDHSDPAGLVLGKSHERVEELQAGVSVGLFGNSLNNYIKVDHCDIVFSSLLSSRFNV